MRIDTASLKGRDAYKLLTGSVVPRPIAFVTTVDSGGTVNAAPFSFFNAVSGNPPMVIVSIGERESGVPKDTAKNILETGEFVVNIVDEALAEKMNLCATPFPPGVSEVEQVGLVTAPSEHIAPPRLVESPISLECRVNRTLDIAGQTLVIGDVLCFQIRDDLYDRGRVDPVKLQAVGRLAGSTYSRTRDLFEIDRLTYEEWLARAKRNADDFS